MLRLFIAGIVMVPVWLWVLSESFGDESIMPNGIWQGPILIVLGVILAIISGRNLFASDDD